MIRLLISSLRFYWRSHVGVLLGTVLAAAVLTGSLLVGDSVDGSLRKMALQRLGGISHALHTPNRFIASSLAERISDDGAAVLQLHGMAIADDRQINRVQVLGCDAAFWNYASLEFELAVNEAALNRKLALALGVEEGDEVSLRIEKPGVLPLDAPLSAQNEDRTVRGRFKVVRIMGADELGGFSLSPNQVMPYNAFVNREWLEGRVGLDGKANLILTGGAAPDARLADVWTPTDFGLQFRRESGLIQLESDHVYLEPEAVRAAMAVTGAQGSLTYLVNSISTENKATPYSFVLAEGDDSLADDDIKINRWLADELGAGVGDSVKVDYYELLPSNRFVERRRIFQVHSIVSMAAMETARKLAPRFPGLTDVDRCADWDVGIPMEEEQLEDEANEAYWNEYKQMPKAIVSINAGQQMWSNRFGSLTGVRWRMTGTEQKAFRSEYNPGAAGYRFLAVREQALAAVDQAMDFGQLFVGMSFFLIVASLMLTGLLFVFGIQKRAEEMGILLAAGWRPRSVRYAVLAEGGMVAFAGSLLGAWLGIGYTRLLIAGLSSHWKGAIAGSAIEFFAEPQTVAAGATISFICAAAALLIAVWRQVKHPARALLMADFTQGLKNDGAPGSATQRRSKVFRLHGLLSALAVGIAAWALLSKAHSLTMPFFGSGALLLIAGILFCGTGLERLGRRQDLTHVGALALQNVARRKGRSLTVVGLLACGCFLTFAVSTMKEDVTAHADESWSGTGGFAWFGESTLPITDDLGGVRLRVRDGDDASCLNLNRAHAPRLLGVDPDALSERNAFMAGEDVWSLLSLELPEGMIPALVGDLDTAMWGLEASTGIEKGDVIDYVDEAGNPFKVKLVGSLPMRLSVFQGTLLVAERDFTERFPSEEGWRMFLLDEPVETRKFSRAGLDVVPATDRLLEFYAVESTYLAMFLVLGALGLAVGTMGMGVVVLRNVQDRRKEMALLQAVGYRRGNLRHLLFVEHSLLLCAGLAVGVLSAALAMVPALFISHSRMSYGFMGILFILVAVCGIACMGTAIFCSGYGSRSVSGLAENMR